MKYEITGTIIDSRNPRYTRSIVWEDGVLSGDYYVVTLADIEMRVAEGVTVGPPEGPYTQTNHVTDPLSALILMIPLFDPDFHASGDLPERGHVPMNGSVPTPAT